MREIDTGFAARLSQNVTTIAKCWQIVGNFGNEICITEHDEDIAFNGKIFKAMNAVKSSNIDLKNAPHANRAAIEGAVSIDGLTENDILLGKYDKAQIRLFTVDWQMAQYFVEIWQGIIGDIKINGEIFEFEITGLESQLNKNIGRRFSRLCDATFGDSNCTINIENYAQNGNFVSLNSPTQIIANFTQALEIAKYKNSKIRFLNGALNQIEFEIDFIEKFSGQWVLNLKSQILPLANAGDNFRLYQSCDKHFETCKARFANGANFRGCPHMPGESIIYASA